MQPYENNQFFSHSSISNVFSIKFAGPLDTAKGGNFFLFCTWWPIVMSIKNETTNVIIKFMEE